MRAGELRHRITLVEPTVVPDGLRGASATVMSTVADHLPAAIGPLEGRELYAAQQINATATHRIRVRYLSGVKPTQRVLFGLRTFEILSAMNVEERNRQWSLLCAEVIR